MGIANTTPAAALIAAFTGAPGRGGHRSRHRHRRRHAGAQGPPWSPARSPGTDPTRPTRSGCWPRSAASSTPRWPASSSAARPAGSRSILDGVIAVCGRAGRGGARPGRGRRPGRRAPLGRAGRLGRARAPGPDPAARPRPAPGRGDRRRAGAADRGQRRPGAARRGHVRLRGSVHKVTLREPLPAGTAAGRPPGAGRRRRRGGDPADAGPARRRRRRGAGLARADPGPARTWPTQARLRWLPRRFEPSDLDGAWLVHVAVDDPAAAAAVSAAAEARQIFCVRADDRDAATAWTPATTRHGPVTVGGDRRRRPPPGDGGAGRDRVRARRPVRRDRQERAPGGGVALVGGGPGDPELITVKGRRLLAAADVVVVDRLAPGLLLDELRPEVEVVDASKIPYGPARDPGRDQPDPGRPGPGRAVRGAAQGRRPVRLRPRRRGGARLRGRRRRR